METTYSTRDPKLKQRIAAEVRHAVRLQFRGATIDAQDLTEDTIRNNQIEILKGTDLEFSLRIPGPNGPRYFLISVKEQRR
jgi:hypothetical protein